MVSCFVRPKKKTSLDLPKQTFKGIGLILGSICIWTTFLSVIPRASLEHMWGQSSLLMLVNRDVTHPCPRGARPPATRHGLCVDCLGVCVYDRSGRLQLQSCDLDEKKKTLATFGHFLSMPNRTKPSSNQMLYNRLLRHLHQKQSLKTFAAW